MNDRFGILIADDGAVMSDSDFKYDTRRKTLIIDLERDPKHMQVFNVSGMTSATDSGPAGRLVSEMVYEFDHNLGYTPLVDCYFYVTEYNGGVTDPRVGGYGYQVYHLSGSAGTVADTISFIATDKKLQIWHFFDAYFGGTGYTSTANLYKFQVKVYVYSIPIGRTQWNSYPYDGNGNVIE